MNEAEPYDPVDAARKIIARAKENPDVKSVVVGVGGLVAICEALVAAVGDEVDSTPAELPEDYWETAQ